MSSKSKTPTNDDIKWERLQRMKKHRRRAAWWRELWKKKTGWKPKHD